MCVRVHVSMNLCSRSVYQAHTHANCGVVLWYNCGGGSVCAGMGPRAISSRKFMPAGCLYYDYRMHARTHTYTHSLARALSLVPLAHKAALTRGTGHNGRAGSHHRGRLISIPGSQSAAVVGRVALTCTCSCAPPHTRTLASRHAGTHTSASGRRRGGAIVAQHPDANVIVMPSSSTSFRISCGWGRGTEQPWVKNLSCSAVPPLQSAE